ncbi:MAG: hypothetical protein IKR05_08325 [Prevotella sp.]|nr:hypothetical protein [Prevotella sp.]
MCLSNTTHGLYYCYKHYCMKSKKSLSIAAAIGVWLDAESVSFTALCGESITHREVLQTAAGTLALIAAVAVGGAV